MPSTSADLATIPTPALVLDRDRMEHNIKTMRAAIGDLPLRPHMKTAKSIDVARSLFPEGVGGITVSTLREAEYFFANGVTDVLYAVGIVPDKVGRVAALVRKGALVRCVVDDIENARQVAAAAAAAGITLRLLIEIDTDGHRAGLAPDDPQVSELARLIHTHPGTILEGIMTHAGESYGCDTPEALAAIAEVERAGALQAAHQLTTAGLPCPMVSAGSTPTALAKNSHAGLTEIRAGVFVFQDLVQSNIGICSIDDIALSVVTTVIGHQRRHGWILVDAGGMALSKDRGTAAQKNDYGFGLITDLAGTRVMPGLKVASANQEHGLIAADDGEPPWEALPIGSRLRILPNHACMTAAAHDRYQVVQTGSTKIITEWPRINGW